MSRAVRCRVPRQFDLEPGEIVKSNECLQHKVLPVDQPLLRFQAHHFHERVLFPHASSVTLERQIEEIIANSLPIAAGAIMKGVELRNPKMFVLRSITSETSLNTLGLNLMSLQIDLLRA